MAVETKRAEELQILDSLYECGHNLPFSPFGSENYVACKWHPEFFEELISENARFLRAARLDIPNDRSPDEMRLQTVQEALLVDQCYEFLDNPLVIVNGGEERATSLYRALQSRLDENPPVEHCIRAEIYYPTARLANLVAKYLAYRAANETLPEHYRGITVDPIREKADREWNETDRARAKRDDEYTPSGVTVVGRRDVEYERLYCWFVGAVSHPAGSSTIGVELEDVVRWATSNDYERLASVCRGYKDE